MSSNPVAVLDLTIQAEGLSVEDVKKHFRSLFKKWTFQLEQGHENDYLHYQCRGSLFKKIRLSQASALVHQVLPTARVDTSSTNSLGESFYVTKLDTRVGGPWDDRDVESFIPYQYQGLQESLYTWQHDVWASADLRDSRHVNLVYDPDGNNGKSTIAALMDLHGRAIDMPPINNAKELLESMCDILIAKDERDPKCVFIDLPRAMDKRQLGGLFTAIEQIKKGKVYDTRYRYREWWFHSPQIWVFTNIEPDLRLLSKDRWVTWTIQNKCLCHCEIDQEGCHDR